MDPPNIPKLRAKEYKLLVLSPSMNPTKPPDVGRLLNISEIKYVASIAGLIPSAVTPLVFSANL